jgi:hypothetical protein
MAKSDSNAPWTIQGFMAAAAAVLWEVHQSRKLRSQANDVMGMFGIKVPDELPSDGQAPEFEFPGATEDPDTHVAPGVKLTDLSPDALARRDAKRLTNLRREVYNHLVSLTNEDPYGYGPDYGTCGVYKCRNHPPAGPSADAAQITRHFGTLGFPQPVTSTTISAILRQGPDELYVTDVKVPGTVTEDDARAKLLPAAYHSAEHNAAVMAFGEDSHSEDLIKSIAVRTRTVWPDSSEIK